MFGKNIYFNDNTNTTTKISIVSQLAAVLNVVRDNTADVTDATGDMLVAVDIDTELVKYQVSANMEINMIENV